MSPLVLGMSAVSFGKLWYPVNATRAMQEGHEMSVADPEHVDADRARGSCISIHSSFRCKISTLNPRHRHGFYGLLFPIIFPVTHDLITSFSQIFHPC
jgi:hypothetical protein